ncbi:hypothetical protein, partial [Klebsiella quasipneumoniae]|uniref:hypothetical protein n=1 Tax=Klebsiella quasipneumoniae TaxID=1463165 RepID=UPI00254CF0CE
MCIRDRYWEEHTGQRAQQQYNGHNGSSSAVSFTSVLPRVFILLLSINNMISPLVITVAK